MVSLQMKSNDRFDVEFSKLVKIKKPSLAPSSLFRSEVKKGMKKDIKATAKKYLWHIATFL